MREIVQAVANESTSDFAVFQFLTALEGASPEELDEFLVRYNMNGIELNEEGFQKLGEEISMDSIETKLEMPWGKENVTLRKGFARQLLADGKVGEVSSHPYYEVCTSADLYELVAALIRSQQVAAV